MEDIRALLEGSGCTGAICVRRLSDGAEVALQADEVWLAASVIKVAIALEFYAQAEHGQIDPRSTVTIHAERRTPGPTGISLAQDPTTMSLRDLCLSMLTVSDNAATDAVLEEVGKAAVNDRLVRLGCTSTVLVQSIREVVDGFALELGFDDYSMLLRAQAGEMGPAALAASTDQDRIGATRCLDVAQATRTTARDMTTLLGAIWTDRAAPAGACANVRRAMSQQVTRRLAVAVPEGGSLAAKTGALFGRVRNEVAVITAPAGAMYAIAVLTRPHRPFQRTVEIDRAMGLAAVEAIEKIERQTGAVTDD